MKAMILAAGRGERLRPLTDHTPKPLLRVGEQGLLEHHILRLHKAGYTELVINTHHLAALIHATIGNGARYGVTVHYSDEQPEALETGGGIRQALPWLGTEPFLVINGDIWSEHPLTPPALAPATLAHLVLVANPEHHPQGDFVLDHGRITATGEPRLTFSGIGWYRPELFTGCLPGRFPLAPLLRAAMANGQVTGAAHQGFWLDVGTPERLQALRDRWSAAHAKTSA
ncbi:MAG: N-acetylmuramate alpha-1-phosphate uridylyltransferase MurU [Thiotrichales bacterium]